MKESLAFFYNSMSNDKSIVNDNTQQSLRLYTSIWRLNVVAYDSGFRKQKIKFICSRQRTGHDISMEIKLRRLKRRSHIMNEICFENA